MSVIKWIHFSDLHFNKTNINTRLLRDSIRSFLTENQIKCDYAFFSGDLRNAPDHCFQKDSVKYLRELCEAVNVSPDHFFMVPGNHDVDREIEKRDQAVKRILDNHGSEKGYYNTDEGKIKESDLRDIKTGQKQYLEIIEEFYEGNPERIEKYKGTSHFLVETEDFNIIHLDSTLVYTKGQDESLVIGTDLLYDLLEKVDQHKYTIILTHYPFDALKAEEKTQVCRILEQFGVDEYEENYRRIVQRSSIGILQLVVEEACSDEQKEYYEKDFRDICEKFYRNRELEIDIIERDTLEKNTNLEKDNKIYISSISVLPVKKEMIYAMDIGIVAQVSATRPVLVGDYDSIQEINRQIEQYYQKTWDEWKEHIECHQNDEMMLERITSQPNKNEISDGTLTDELTYEVTHNDSSILSILFDRYLYLGGAHGTPLRKSMVVNLNTGEPIKLHEILPVSFSELMDILRNQLYVRYGSEDTEVLEVCYKNIVDLYHEVDEFKFYIRYSALYIYFDVYEISSYSMGYVDLYIMDLQEFLSERCDISECDIVRKQAIFEKIFKPNIR